MNDDRFVLRLPRYGLFFMLGAVATLGQVLFIREFLTIAFGNEAGLGLFLFVWFLGVAAGAAVGGKIATIARRKLDWLIFLLILLSLLLGVQLVIVRCQRYFLDVPPGEYMSLGRLLQGALIGVFPFSFLIGLVFPFAGQVARGEGAASPGGVTNVYILEAFGSLAVGLLLPYALLAQFSAPTMAKGAAILVAALGVLLSAQRLQPKDIGGAVRTIALILWLTVLALVPAQKIEQTTAALRWKSQFPAFQLVESRESPYGHLDLAEDAGQYSLFDSGKLVTTFPDPYSPLEPVHCAMVQHASPESVLLVGGDPEMIRLVLSHGPRRVDWVELDPVLLSLILEYTSEDARRPLDDPRVTLLYEDGRRLIRRTKSEYDLIVLSVPDPSTAQLNRYYTEEFYAEARRALKPGGVLATSIQASIHATGEEVLGYGRVIDSALRRLFPEVVVQPGQTYRFYASESKGQVTEDPEIMAERFRRRGAQPEPFAYTFKSLYQSDLVEEVRAGLASGAAVPANTDFHPVAYLYQLLLWNRWAGGTFSSILLRLKNCSPLWMLALAGILLALRFLILRRKTEAARRCFDLSAAVAVLGLTGMAIELILLFGYQNAFGVLYQNIARIVALFMFGLTMGAFGVNRILERRRLPDSVKWFALRALLLVSAVFALVLPMGVQLAGQIEAAGPAIFYGLTFASGLLTGCGFPLSIALYHRADEPIARAAGVIDSSDHLGAMIGALLAGTFWLPLWGVWTTCLILAAANAGMFILFLTKREKSG